MSDWQPIACAKEGQRILVQTRYGHVMIACRKMARNRQFYWVDDQGIGTTLEFVAWQDLPKPHKGLFHE